MSVGLQTRHAMTGDRSEWN